jgi:hypothetical protein
MAYTTRLAFEVLRSVNSASLAGAYLAVGGPLLFPSYILKIVNNSTSLVTVSFDGINDYDVLPGTSYTVYDELKTVNHEGFPEGTQIYVKGSAGSGLIYVVSQYLITN